MGTAQQITQCTFGAMAISRWTTPRLISCSRLAGDTATDIRKPTLRCRCAGMLIDSTWGGLASGQTLSIYARNLPEMLPTSSPLGSGRRDDEAAPIDRGRLARTMSTTKA